VKQRKTYRGLFRKVSAVSAAGGSGGGREHYAFGGQLPAASGTSLFMREPNIQWVHSVFQTLGSLAR